MPITPPVPVAHLQLEAKFDELSMPAFLNSTCKMEPFEVPAITSSETGGLRGNWGRWRGVKYWRKSGDKACIAEVWWRKTVFGAGDQRSVQWFVAPDQIVYELERGAIVRKSSTPKETGA